MINDAVRSVSQQTYPDVELVVVDDGSDDLSDADVETLRRSRIGNVPVKCIRIENSGVSRARNVGLEHASGDYICFLDSDDLLFPDAIGQLMHCIEGSEAQYCVGRIVETDHSLAGPFWDADPIGTSDILRRAGWMTHASLYRREAVVAVGGFDEQLRVGEDSIFQLNILARYGDGATCPEFVGVRRRHGYGHLSSERGRGIEHARYLALLCDTVADSVTVASASRGPRALLLFAILYGIRRRSDLESQSDLLERYRRTCRKVLPGSPALARAFCTLAADAGSAGRYGSLALLSLARGLRRSLSMVNRPAVRRELHETTLLDRISALSTMLRAPPEHGGGVVGAGARSDTSAAHTNAVERPTVAPTIAITHRLRELLRTNG